MMRLTCQSQISQSEKSEQKVEDIATSTDITTQPTNMSSTAKQPGSLDESSSSTAPASASATDVPMTEGTRTTMDDDAQLHEEVTSVFDSMELISKRLDKVEHKLRLCDLELKKADRRRHWDDAEHLRPPRKWPLNDDCLENSPLLGLRDDRDYRNPDWRPYPPSAHDPWLGNVDAYAHEQSWTNGPWGRQVTPNRGPTWGQWRVEPIDEHK